MSEYILEVRNITKSFPGVLANDNISFGLKKGEIHAFLGENGAGKSTLMNIIYGLYDPDDGQILPDIEREHGDFLEASPVGERHLDRPRFAQPGDESGGLGVVADDEIPGADPGN